MQTLPRHLPVLDTVRGVAILMVFLYHAMGASWGQFSLRWDGWLPDLEVARSYLALVPLTFGKYGVAVFFVVSGFCIHLSHARSSQPGWRRFFYRRFFRIYPPYALALVFFAVAWPWTWLDFATTEGQVQWALHALALHNLLNWTFLGINPSFWSIAVEVQLYAIYPLLLWLASRWGWGRSLIVAGVLEVGLRAWDSYLLCQGGEPLPRVLADSPFAYWLGWALGAYLAETALAGKRNFLANLPFWPLALVAFVAGFFLPTAGFCFLLFALLTAVALAKHVENGWVLVPSSLWPGWLGRHLRHLGLVSYSFYLLHEPLLDPIQDFYRWLTGEVTQHGLVNLGACLLLYFPILWVSYGFFCWVEQPAIELGKRYLQRKGT